MSRRTGIVKDSRYLQHATGFAHLESPERLMAIHEMLDNPHMSWKYVDIEPRVASRDEIAYVHTPSYIDYIAGTAGKDSVFLDSDTLAGGATYEVARPGGGRFDECH
jgi:acetoin utilization deacetylase AcuC-like enzyme